MIRNNLIYPEDPVEDEELEFEDLDPDYDSFDSGLKIISPEGEVSYQDLFSDLEISYTVDGWYSYKEIGPNSLAIIYSFYLENGKIIFQENVDGSFYCFMNDLKYPSKEICNKLLKLKAFV